MAGTFNKDRFDAVLDGLTRKGITTLGDNISALVYDSMTITPGGIHIPKDAEKKPVVATVVQLGQAYDPDGSVPRYAKGLKVGDHITFNAYDGKEHSLAITKAWQTKLGNTEPVELVLVLNPGNLYWRYHNGEDTQQGCTSSASGVGTLPDQRAAAHHQHQE